PLRPILGCPVGLEPSLPVDAALVRAGLDDPARRHVVADRDRRLADDRVRERAARRIELLAALADRHPAREPERAHRTDAASLERPALDHRAAPPRDPAEITEQRPYLRGRGRDRFAHPDLGHDPSFLTGASTRRERRLRGAEAAYEQDDRARPGLPVARDL